MGLYRPRKEFKFWLCHDRHEDTRLMEYIAFLKGTRQFARVVRDGLRLMWSLKEGNLAVLFELFPHLEKQFNPDATELMAEFRAMMLHSRVVDAPVGAGATSNKLAAVQVALPTFEDDDDDDTLVIGKATGTMNGNNFMAGLLSLGIKMGEDKKFNSVRNRALIAEMNEATFRRLLEEAHEVLAHLPLPTPVITDLRYRILDTLNETKLLREREW